MGLEVLDNIVKMGMLKYWILVKMGLEVLDSFHNGF